MKTGLDDECLVCGGKMHEGTTEIKARIGDVVVVITNIPALVCEHCDEAYYSLETARKIDEVRKAFHAGKLVTKPIAACELDLSSVSICQEMISQV